MHIASPPELLSLHMRDPGKYVELPRAKVVSSLSVFAVISWPNGMHARRAEVFLGPFE